MNARGVGGEHPVNEPDRNAQLDGDLAVAPAGGPKLAGVIKIEADRLAAKADATATGGGKACDRPLPDQLALSYKQWGTVFRDASCLGALIDRFAQHCHTVDIDADSWRNTEALKRGKKKKGEQ
jgi:hypothetical protein